MKFDDVIAKRCSCREFSSKKVHWGKVLEAIDSAIHAPLAGNICNFRFIIIKDQKTKNKLAECCVQDWVADAYYVLVICADVDNLERMYDDRGKRYSRQQVGAAIENFILKLTDQGIASCWVGAYTDATCYDILEIPHNMTVEAIIPVGIAKKTAKLEQSRKTALENVIYWEKWGTKKKPWPFKDPQTR